MELLRGIQLGGGVVDVREDREPVCRSRAVGERMLANDVFRSFSCSAAARAREDRRCELRVLSKPESKGRILSARTAVRPHFGLATDAWRCGAGQLLSLWRCCLAWSARPQRRPVRRRPADSCAPLPETAWRSIAADPRCFLAPAASVSTPIVPRGPCLGCSRLARGSARDRGRERGAGSLSQPFTP